MAKKISEEIKQKIIDLYQDKTNKYTKKQIALECGCSTDTVTRTLQKAGLQEIKLSIENQKIEQQIVTEFLDGSYCKELAKKFHVDEHTIYRILDKNNIKRQTGYHSKCIEDYFSQIDNPHKAYLLGFITADGAIVNNVLSIEIHKDDVDVLNFAKEQINPQATLTPTKAGFKVSFSAKALGRDLAKYGVVQNKSKILKKVPLDLIPRKFLCFYFRGLIDGDGCVHKDGRLSIYSGSEDFIKDVQSILIKELQLTPLKVYHGTTYFISWSSKLDKQKLFNYLYQDLNATFYYKRKYQRLKENI